MSEDRIVAEIAAVYSDGVTLKFGPNSSSAGSKHYKCNTTAELAAGDTVIATKIGGTYVVDYKVGRPNSGSGGGGGGAVTSVNGQTGAVTLTAADVGAVAKSGLSNVLLSATSVQFTGSWTTIPNVLSSDIKKYAIAIVSGYFGSATVAYQYGFQCVIVPTAGSTATVSFTTYNQAKGTLLFNLSSTNPSFYIYKGDGTVMTSGQAQIYQIQGVLPLS